MSRKIPGRCLDPRRRNRAHVSRNFIYSHAIHTKHKKRYFSFTSPICYWRIIGQILGHGDWGHLSGNIVNLLLVSPACEHEYGAYNLLKIIVWTAGASGLAHMLFGGSDAVWCM